MSTASIEHIHVDERGVARIIGSRIKVIHLVMEHRANGSVGECIRDLELVSLASDPVDLADKVIHLPFP